MAQKEHDAAGRRDADQGRERDQLLVMLMGQTEEVVEHLLRPFSPRELDRVPLVNEALGSGPIDVRAAI
jgi:hypothetical protein